MEEINTDRYITKLQTFVKTMNSRVNRSTKMAPENVQNRDAIRIINSKLLRREKPSFHVGDYVRLSGKEEVFRKGYKPQFTREIFQIVSIATRNPVTYVVKDKNKEVIQGKFYERELIHYAI